MRGVIKDYEILISGTFTAEVIVGAESPEHAREQAAVELEFVDFNPNRLGGSQETYYTNEPTEKWTVREATE